MIVLAVRNPWAGARVVCVPRTSSTMDDAVRLRAAGANPGSVVVAGFQDAGRGRFSDRTWVSPPGTGLLFTLVLDAELGKPFPRTPLVAGLALAVALEQEFALTPRVKWPNDVLLGNRKVAGILCEVKADPLEDSRRICLVGVGVNCNQKEQPLELADRAISVRQVVDCRISRLRLLESFLRVFHRLLQDDCWRPELERRLFGIGRWVVVRRVAGQDLSGILVGLAEDGALLVAERGEERPPTPVYTGELATGPHLDPDRF